MADNGRLTVRQVQQALDLANKGPKDLVKERSNDVTRHRVPRQRAPDSGGAPRGSTSFRTSQAEADRIQREMDELVARMNAAQTTDSNNP